jgi:hypothetical protein
MGLDHAENVIGVGTEYNMKHVLKCFEIVHWVNIENCDYHLLPEIIEAKNTLIRSLVRDQKRKYRVFEIESPFKNTCPRCRGSGEIFKFFKKTVKVNCHICGRAGTVDAICPKCRGSGRFIKRWKQGGGVNLECKKCKGKGKIKVNCKECVGKGQIPKGVLCDEIESTTPCRKCGQLGFIVKDSPKSKKKKSHKSERRPFKPFPTKTRDGKNLADVIKLADVRKDD